MTEPIEQLKLEITGIVEKCREIGSNRFITEHYLSSLDDRVDEALKLIESGILNDIPELNEPTQIDDLIKDTNALEKE